MATLTRFPPPPARHPLVPPTLDLHNLLADVVYPLFHSEARYYLQHGMAAVLRHHSDAHLVPIETDPVGLKLYTASAQVGRKGLEQQLVNRHLLCPDYVSVLGWPVTGRVRLEYLTGGLQGMVRGLNEYSAADVTVAAIRADLERYRRQLPYWLH